MATTFAAEETALTWVSTQAEQDAHDDKKDDSRGGQGAAAHCRLCKSNEHWSHNCPMKVSTSYLVLVLGVLALKRVYEVIEGKRYLICYYWKGNVMDNTLPAVLIFSFRNSTKVTTKRAPMPFVCHLQHRALTFLQELVVEIVLVVS